MDVTATANEIRAAARRATRSALADATLPIVYTATR